MRTLRQEHLQRHCFSSEIHALPGNGPSIEKAEQRLPA